MGEGGKKARQIAAKKSVMYSPGSKVIKVLTFLCVCFPCFGLSIGFVIKDVFTFCTNVNIL